MFKNSLARGIESLSKSVVLAAAFIFCAAVVSINAATGAVAENNNLPIQDRMDVLASTVNSCALAKIVTEPVVRDLLSPAANLCLTGSLANTDRTFNRPLASSTGTGIGNGTAGNCSLSSTATASRRDTYNLTLTGCAVFPTEITATLCGPAGCQHLGNVDTTLLLYRNVAAGDPLTANGGLPAVFSPTSPCTNARAQSDDLGTTSGTPNNPGGATCNQAIGANCVAPCTSPSNAGGLSAFRRNIGNGNFTLVVAGFGNATVGSYNLYVDAPAAGCVISLVPTAAAVSISGQVITPHNLGTLNPRVTITDSQANSQTVLSGKTGNFRFTDLTAGETYTVSVSAKRYTFAAQVVTATEDLTDLVFTAQ